MAKKIIMLAAFILLIPCLANAQGPQGRPFGLGLSAGEPAGINAKYWLGKKDAIDMAIGYGFYPHRGPALFADYVYHAFNIVRAGKVPFNLLFYMGAGIKLGFWYYDRRDEHRSGFGMGIRIPFGVTMVFTKAPFDIFLEVTPSMAFINPDPFYFDLDACLGGRFYF